MSSLYQTQVFLGIGSNIDKENAIPEALVILENQFGKLVISPTFESESVGFNGDNFYNLVVSFYTAFSLQEVVSRYKAIEDQLGRDRSGPKFSARSLDIDPLLYGDLICDEPVELPRGEVLENAYVLWPLSILAPDHKHPLTGRSFSDHWQSYDNNQKLWQVETSW
ncbi:MAG: 2-amino-4-hydroxy-6-hydroxymethyldihydropteridine diphosphokinase [Gammaproteobacteria bacterium]|nr:2-amino-4-hydroxy-6-hydroxymethyldihydropteridine diphosphokinase [Gammaproteobacteria bacterium]